MQKVTQLQNYRSQPNTRIFFDRKELDAILNVYGMMVAKGEWRDYAMGDDQEQAIFAISQRSGDRRAIEALRGYARRTDIPSDLRADAIFWISQNPNAGGAEYLIELYPQLEDPELRERAIFGIAQSGGDEARDWLLERVRDDRESVEARKNALFWAGQIGGDIIEQLQGLYGTLDDREMKEQLIFVASQDGGRASVDFLMEVARGEEDGELRENAIFWLGQTDDPRVPEFLLSLVRG